MKKILFFVLALVCAMPALAQTDSTKPLPFKVEKKLRQFSLLSPTSTFRPLVTLDLNQVEYYLKASTETTLVGIDGKEIEIILTYEEFDKLMRRLTI